MVPAHILRRSLIVTGLAMNLVRVAIIPLDGVANEVIPEQTQAQTRVDIADDRPGSATEIEITASSKAPAPQRPTPEADGEQLGEIQHILDTIRTGRAALKTLEQQQISVRFGSGSGSHYVLEEKTIVLDSELDTVLAALVLVHEATHVKYSAEERDPDPSSLPRDEYVRRMLEEEAEAEMAKVQAKMELKEAGTYVPEIVAAYFEWLLKRAYRREKAAHSDLSQDELEKVVRRVVGGEAVDGLMTGVVLASTEDIPYPVLYGSYWDAVNNARVGRERPPRGGA